MCCDLHYSHARWSHPCSTLSDLLILSHVLPNSVTLSQKLHKVSDNFQDNVFNESAMSCKHEFHKGFYYYAACHRL